MNESENYSAKRALLSRKLAHVPTQSVIQWALQIRVKLKRELSIGHTLSAPDCHLRYRIRSPQHGNGMFDRFPFPPARIVPPNSPTQPAVKRAKLKRRESLPRLSEDPLGWGLGPTDPCSITVHTKTISASALTCLE